MIYIKFDDGIQEKINRLGDDLKIIEINGLPDSGCTLTAIHLSQYFKSDFVLYLGLKYKTSESAIISHYFDSLDKSLIVYLQDSFEDENALLKCVKEWGAFLDTIIIDDAALFLLYKSKARIKSFFSILRSLAIKMNLRIIVINQVRFNLNIPLNTNSRVSIFERFRGLYSDYTANLIDLSLRVYKNEEESSDIFVAENITKELLRIKNNSPKHKLSLSEGLKSLIMRL